ncbi:MAG: peptidylprolyl isomerase [Candidatus Binatia bacterium]
MARAKQGATVKVHYTGKLEDGTVFDTSADGEPLEFTIGERQVIPAFEQAVVGMLPGQSKRTEVPADKAFGPHREELVLRVNRTQLPAELKPEIGQQLEFPAEDDETIELTVTDVSESSVTLDANHPLAGRDVTFYIHLVEVA